MFQENSRNFAWMMNPNLLQKCTGLMKMHRIDGFGAKKVRNAVNFFGQNEERSKSKNS